MTIPGSSHALLLSSLAGYEIPNSLRFRASNSAYLERTPAGAGNRRTWTWSAWVKRGTLGGAVSMNLFVGNRAGTTDATYTSITFTTSNQLAVSGYATNWRITTAVFRDPTAWMHIVVALDTTQATASDRVKVYVNGTQITAFGTSNNPALNADLGINQAALHSLGRDVSGGPTFFDGYMAEVNFIDGQALTPSSFGSTDSATGVWVPKKYGGTYGTNGFYLKFADASAATAAAIGKDSSGNGNNLTPSGISVTSGVTFDQMTDTPTNNYATLSPLTAASESSQGVSTLTNANLTVATQSNRYSRTDWVLNASSPKMYYEIHMTTVDSGFAYPRCGIALTSYTGTDLWAPGEVAGQGFGFRSSGAVHLNGSLLATYTAFTSGSVAMIAFDPATGKVWLGKDGTWFASGDPAAGTGNVTTLTGSEWRAFVGGVALSGSAFSINFGQRAFIHAVPTTFKALNTQNITSTAVSTSGSFTGNASADGPFVWTNGNPATLTINGNAVTFGTHADKTAGGFKLRSSSASYNASGSNSWTATAGKRFVQSKKPNNAQTN